MGGLESREWNTRLALSRRRDIPFIVIGKKKCMDINAAKVDFEICREHCGGFNLVPVFF